VTGRLFPVDNVLDTDDWYTPRWVFDGLGIRFDLDVAAPDGGAPNVPADAYYTVADDGLAQPWHGRVWCNPPYSAPTLWCHRWAAHDDGMILLRADLSTGGPFTAWSAAHACWVPRRRLQFDHYQRERGGGGSVTFSTVLFARGHACVDALRRLEQHAGGATRLLTQQIVG